MTAAWRPVLEGAAAWRPVVDALVEVLSVADEAAWRPVVGAAWRPALDVDAA